MIEEADGQRGDGSDISDEKEYNGNDAFAFPTMPNVATMANDGGDSDVDSEGEDEALMRSGRLFGGVINDIKRKVPWIKSDFTDALSSQTLASIIYIYLATVTKAITFGGFLGDITEGRQGVLEAFLGHALAGGCFCLFGGQPLTVLGCTGPVLIFENILIETCKSYELDYMTFRLWIGLWSVVY